MKCPHCGQEHPDDFYYVHIQENHLNHRQKFVEIPIVNIPMYL